MSAALAPGESYRTQVTGIDIPKYFRGDVQIIVQTDARNFQDEFPNEGNNELAVAVTVDITETPPADLIVNNVVGPDLAIDGSTIDVRYRVINSGAGENFQERFTTTIWLMT